jgi:hypothetical protein
MISRLISLAMGLALFAFGMLLRTELCSAARRGVLGFAVIHALRKGILI